MRKPRKGDEAKIDITEPDDHAAGIPGVAVALKRSVQKMGPRRAARALLKLNQAEGFDCMSCAWPDPDPGHRHTAEFCENGAKAVAEEAHDGAGDAGVLRPTQHRRPGPARRALAGPAGPDHPSHGQEAGRDPLRADRVGRRRFG